MPKTTGVGGTGYSPISTPEAVPEQACVDQTSSEVKATLERLSDLERNIETKLEQALLTTAGAILTCAMPSPVGCIVAGTKVASQLLELDAQSERYEHAVDDYYSALAAHLDCLGASLGAEE